jgi:hypothetical protein
VVLRAAVLLGCLVVWTLRRDQEAVVETPSVVLPRMRPALGAG